MYSILPNVFQQMIHVACIFQKLNGTMATNGEIVAIPATIQGKKPVIEIVQSVSIGNPQRPELFFTK